MSGAILAAGDSLRLGVRYPERIWCDGALVEVEAHPGGKWPAGREAPLAVIIDGDAAIARHWLAGDVPLLLAPGAVQQLQADGVHDLAAARWACWSPVAFAPEVGAARAVLADDGIGPLVGGDIVVPVGLGSLDDARWEPDTGCALDAFEAVTLGLDLLRHLDLPVPSDEAGSSPSPGAEPALVHDLGDGVLVGHRLCDAADTSVPGYQATLRGRYGRILLRAEMAPSALTVWDNASRSLRCPALPKGKPNIQSPDTARGGAETAQQLAEISAGRTPAPSELASTLDLLEHAERCTAELDHKGPTS